MDDDWLVDEEALSPDNYQHYVRDREWNSLKSAFHKTGYREGVQEGTEQARQRGFESGLAQGGPALWPSGYCTGVLDTLCTFYARPDAPALSTQQRSELDALVAELAALSDEQLLQETASVNQLRTERIQKLLTALDLGVVPDPTKHTA